jgi:hypothetical protein
MVDRECPVEALKGIIDIVVLEKPVAVSMVFR